MTRTPDRRRFPPCGRVFDGELCRKRGEHLCAPRAAHAVAFFAELLVHTKGDWSRRPFVLADWERTEIVEPLIGTVEWDPTRERYVRRYRELYLSTGRKNGKTEIVAGLMLYLLCADDEDGAELYGLALDKDQASLAFNVAARMVALSPPLAARLAVLRAARRIVDEQTASFWAVMAGDAMGNLGPNPHAAYIDELLAQPSRDLYDALRTGFGTRAQPLMILTTTADNDPTGFAASERAWSEKVADDPELDHGRLVVLHAVPIDADWADERNWYLANPALGDYLSLATLRGEYVKTLSNPAAERAFRQFRCNQQGSRAGRAINLPTWDQAPAGPDADELLGRECYAGLDLASTIDLASYCLDFPLDDGEHAAIWRVFTPEARLADLDRRTGGKASAWAESGELTVTDGDVIDYGAIVAAMTADRALYDIREVAFDRWGATQLSTSLLDDGWPLVQMGQGFATMSGPTKELLRLIAARTYRHRHNPVVRWQADNLVTRTDPAGNIKPDKSRSADKIDSLVAAIMALDRAIRHAAAQQNDYVAAGF
jgi:phage terminase large subunit-like protein